MKLNLDILPCGRSSLLVDETCRLDLEEGDAGEVRIVGELQADGTVSRVSVRGDLVVSGKAECDRCLAGFEMRYVAEVDVAIVRDKRVDDEEDGSAWTVHRAQGEVDLTPALKEAALLTLPQKMICREDCRGICTHCGADRNVETCDCAQEIIDPRWDGLPS
ncbi:DUF177 domain-containing protein [bacterium]|nr:DUF177 domain-containing protein [bacterium]MBU1073077.1 DUF177 domain-containing protein [bacterium]MBU1675790.1 DUF177 domain-containing protein [bacterium]